MKPQGLTNQYWLTKAARNGERHKYSLLARGFHFRMDDSLIWTHTQVTDQVWKLGFN
jgi:hypothetical protein